MSPKSRYQHSERPSKRHKTEDTSSQHRHSDSNQSSHSSELLTDINHPESNHKPGLSNSSPLMSLSSKDDYTQRNANSSDKSDSKEPSAQPSNANTPDSTKKPTSQKHTRAARACETCRRQKTRCVSAPTSRSCFRCLTLGLDCSLVQEANDGIESELIKGFFPTMASSNNSLENNDEVIGKRYVILTKTESTDKTLTRLEKMYLKLMNWNTYHSNHIPSLGPPC